MKQKIRLKKTLTLTTLTALLLFYCNTATEEITEQKPYIYKVPETLNDGWETGHLAEAGFDQVTIEEMGFKVLNKINFPNIHAILVVKNGKIVFEEYYYNYNINMRHDLRSATKSFTSLLMGIAIEKDFIKSADEKVYPFFPEYPSFDNWDIRKSKMDIDNLLTMRSGLDSDDWLYEESPGSEYYLYQSEDWIKFMLDLPMVADPGEKFAYSSGGVIVIGGIITNATGMSISKFSDQYLFGPLEITDFLWRTYSFGTNTGGNLELRPRDMARFGQMVLKKGVWKNSKIISPEWLNKSVIPYVDVPNNTSWGSEYGYLWWISRVFIKNREINSFGASGNGGQVIQIFPYLDMVAVFTGGNFYPNDKGYPYKLMEQYILPALIH